MFQICHVLYVPNVPDRASVRHFGAYDIPQDATVGPSACSNYAILIVLCLWAWKYMLRSTEYCLSALITLSLLSIAAGEEVTLGTTFGFQIVAVLHLTLT